MKRLALLGVCAFLASVLSASAQVTVNLAQARIEFTSPSHDAVFQPGTVGAGDPVTSAYRAVVIPSAADPVTGVAVFSGGPTPKTLATIVGASLPATYSLTFAQLGISAATLPACVAVAPAVCPSYAIVLLATGTGGASARSAAAESDSFTVQGLLPQTPPASPANGKVKGS